MTVRRTLQEPKSWASTRFCIRLPDRPPPNSPIASESKFETGSISSGCLGIPGVRFHFANLGRMAPGMGSQENQNLIGVDFVQRRLLRHVSAQFIVGRF